MSNKRKPSSRSNTPGRNPGSRPVNSAVPAVPETTGNSLDFEISGLTFRQQSVLAREAIENPDPSIRIRAARYALNYAFKFSDFDKLADDVRDLQSVVLEGQ